MPGESAAGRGPVLLRVADPEHALAGVRLVVDLDMAPELLEFRRGRDSFELALDPPPVSRLEYLLELRYPGGGTKVLTDRRNPRQVAGAFGPKSVLEFPGYAPPGWLSAPADLGVSTALETAIPARIWSPSGVGDDQPLPLLVVHDGPEYDSLASLTRTWAPVPPAAGCPAAGALCSARERGTAGTPPARGTRARWFARPCRY